VISGTGIAGMIKAFQTCSVQIDMKDSSGNHTGVVGKAILIEIRNKCSVTQSYFWSEDSCAKRPLASHIKAQMIDKGDGTYTYGCIIEKSCYVSFVAIWLNKYGIQTDFYPSIDFSMKNSFNDKIP
jgi:hypothetical protein